MFKRQKYVVVHTDVNVVSWNFLLSDWPLYRFSHHYIGKFWWNSLFFDMFWLDVMLKYWWVRYDLFMIIFGVVSLVIYCVVFTELLIGRLIEFIIYLLYVLRMCIRNGYIFALWVRICILKQLTSRVFIWVEIFYITSLRNQIGPSCYFKEVKIENISFK